jgi:hypothetical protein
MIKTKSPKDKKTKSPKDKKTTPKDNSAQNKVKIPKDKQDPQIKRLDSSKDVTFLNFENGKQFVFSVKGDSGIYTVTVNKDTGKMTCSCFDMKFWCEKNNCVCKHACYVLLKVLPFNYRKTDAKLFCYNPGKKIESRFLATRVFTKEELEMINSTLKWKYPDQFSCCSSIGNLVSNNLGNIMFTVATGVLVASGYFAGKYL